MTGVSQDEVRLEVDRWYAGGRDRTVVLSSGGAGTVSLEGVDFLEGSSYLVAATDSTVNGCGFSGRWTPELAESYEAAFERRSG